MSTATIATILLLGVFLVLVFLRVPVVYAIGVASLLDFFYAYRYNGSKSD